MVDLKGNDFIRAIRRRWMVGAILSNVLISLSVAVICFTLLLKTGNLYLWWSIPLFAGAVLWILFIYRNPSATDNDVSRYLNGAFPELEESSGLLLKPYHSLNFLEKLQVDKVEEVLLKIQRPALNNRIKVSSSIFLAVILLSLSVAAIPNLFRAGVLKSAGTSPLTKESSPSSPGKLPASIRSVLVKIIPPAYTGKRLREQEGFNLQAEEGAKVVWQLNTNTFVSQLNLIFNDRKVVTVQPLNDQHTSWEANTSIKHSGFYQVSTENNLSVFYKIEMIKDQPPVIHMLAPASYTLITPGEPKKVTLKVALADDYGITSANVFATIASGSGEAVKFKEQQVSFDGFKGGNRQYQLQKKLDLSALGLAPGDELYYYVKAIDNKKQESRSDIFIIALPDTAELLSMEGMTTGVNLVPEYFRSQRQIIIETEQLLKAKDTLSVEEFNNRSNNLGTDQKLLRLRYGKFLGEETDAEIGHDHDEDEGAHHDASEFGNATSLMDAYSHKHDNSEDASFFEPEIKAQLKATLAEMWKSELQLRTYKPQQALPFEYKALRLLKDLQQKSRVYVAKTSFKSTPLKPEKRLTGDLSKIIQPVAHLNYQRKDKTLSTLKSAVSILELLAAGHPVSPEQRVTLEEAGRQIATMAAAQPVEYVQSLSSMQRILENVSRPSKIKAPDIRLVENALQQIIPLAAPLPVAPAAYPTLNLTRDYFKNLNRGIQ